MASLTTVEERLRTLAREAPGFLPETEGLALYQAAIAAIVRELAEWHQRFIDEDPEGERLFVPYLPSLVLLALVPSARSTSSADADLP